MWKTETMKKNEHSFSDPWDNIKLSNTSMNEVLDGEENENGEKNIWGSNSQKILMYQSKKFSETQGG